MSKEIIIKYSHNLDSTNAHVLLDECVEHLEIIMPDEIYHDKSLLKKFTSKIDEALRLGQYPDFDKEILNMKCDDLDNGCSPSIGDCVNAFKKMESELKKFVLSSQSNKEQVLKSIPLKINGKFRKSGTCWITCPEYDICYLSTDDYAHVGPGVRAQALNENEVMISIHKYKYTW